MTSTSSPAASAAPRKMRSGHTPRALVRDCAPRAGGARVAMELRRDLQQLQLRDCLRANRARQRRVVVRVGERLARGEDVVQEVLEQRSFLVVGLLLVR